MLLLAAFLLLWDAPPCEPDSLAYRVEQVHIYQIGVAQGWDEDGNPVEMPIYSPWIPVFVQRGAAQEATILCTPLVGELCVGIVTSIDEAGNEDLGENCVDTAGG